MANFLNIFIGILTLIGSSAMVYGLWTPVISFLNYFPTALYIMCGSMWVTLCFSTISFMPFIMMVSDDKGE